MNNNLTNAVFFLVKNFYNFIHFHKVPIILKKYLENYNEIKKNGVTIIPNYLSRIQTEAIRDSFDLALNNHNEFIQTNEYNNDLRIFGIEKINKIANDFLNDDFLIDLIKKYENYVNIVEKTTLGARIQYKIGTLGSGGGWHRDRTFYKYRYTKAMIYLNDVDNNNGPFQYLVGSHRLKNIIKLNYKYDIKYSTKEFANTLIDKIVASKDLEIKTCFCKKGDVIIFDGTGIHRGKPLKEGSRYAITNYYRFDPQEILPYKNLNSIKIKIDN
jgi:ectoine hydroxylase-related dioxygenase (phytanoyl-CoA dioxygenase family)